MADLLVEPRLGPAHAQAALSPGARRLQAEWRLLLEFCGLNPQRLADPAADDLTFTVTLLATPALALDQAAEDSDVVTRHQVRVDFPRYFPAVPMELYLERPVLHPNVHPQTGFVCLWDAHRSEYNVEHALHRLAAMLGWRLLNLDSSHVMQAQPAAMSEDARAQLAARLAAEPLSGLDHSPWQSPLDAPRRRRLS